MRFLFNKQAGFTLVEMIVVIVITGIISGMVAMFIKAPVQGYMDSARRAEMTDIADTALRRMARDVRTAVPNSVQVTGICPICAVEFLPTKAGGRYRASPKPSGAVQCGGTLAEDILDFSIADTCFEIIGTAIPLVRGATDDTSDQIIVGSTQSDGNPPYDKTFAGNGVRRPYTGATGTLSRVQILGEQFPAFAELPGQRFDVVPGDQQAVTYACETNSIPVAAGDGTLRLMRYWNYGFTHTRGATKAILADKVSACTIDYDLPNQRFGLLAVRLTLTSGNENVSLYNEIHVNNLP